MFVLIHNTKPPNRKSHATSVFHLIVKDANYTIHNKSISVIQMRENKNYFILLNFIKNE